MVRRWSRRRRHPENDKVADADADADADALRNDDGENQHEMPRTPGGLQLVVEVHA